MKALATPAALILAALAYFVPSVAGGAPVVYAACTTIAILAVMAYGADLILSYLGEVSLGHTIFWAAGGYAASMLAVNAGWNGWQTAGAAILVALVLAAVLGLRFGGSLERMELAAYDAGLRDIFDPRLQWGRR